MADSPYRPALPQRPLQTAVQGLRNLAATVQVVAEADPVVVTSPEPLDVSGTPFIRVTNNSGGSTAVTSTIGDTATPMTEEDGTVLSLATATCRLVDVRGVNQVAFPDEDVTVVLVN